MQPDAEGRADFLRRDRVTVAGPSQSARGVRLLEQAKKACPGNSKSWDDTGVQERHRLRDAHRRPSSHDNSHIISIDYLAKCITDETARTWRGTYQSIKGDRFTSNALLFGHVPDESGALLVVGWDGRFSSHQRISSSDPV